MGVTGDGKQLLLTFENDQCKIVFLKQSAEIRLCIHIHHNFYADIHNQFALAYNKLTTVRHANKIKQTNKKATKTIKKIKQNGLLIAIDKDAATQWSPPNDILSILYNKSLRGCNTVYSHNQITYKDKDREVHRVCAWLAGNGLVATKELGPISLMIFHRRGLFEIRWRIGFNITPL